ncbi:MAG: alpha-galactosidase, partial [Demequina sp.]
DGGELIGWSARAADSGRRYAALFWTGESDHVARVPLASLTGLPHRPHAVTSLWPDATVSVDGTDLVATVAAHGVVWVALDEVAA